MKKGQIYEGVVAEVDFPNKAIIPYQDELQDGTKTEVRVQVKGGIQGQKVSFAVKRARRDNCKGRLLEILEKSFLETEQPICPQFGTCGGCSYQSIPYDKQLELKKNQVLKLIDGVYPVNVFQTDGTVKQREKDYIYDGILKSPSVTAYRNKMEFSFGDEKKDGPLTLGLHKKGSFHDILDAGCCKIVHEDMTKVLACVRDYCTEQKIPHYKKSVHEGILRHLLVRRADSTGELLAALVVSSQRMECWETKGAEEIWRKLAYCLQELPLEGKLAGFLLVTNDSLGDVVQSDKTEILYGRDYIMEEILGLQFKISVFSFFQTNTKGAEVLYGRARDYILGDYSGFNKGSAFASKASLKMEEGGAGVNLRDKVVFDLYSGTGTIAQMIAPVAGKVIGVEIVEEAVKAARENAAMNGLKNCEFIAGDVLEVLDTIEDKPDYIILDPPRDGIHPKALRRIIDYGVQNIVYISCKPTSLARDLEVFEANGYELKRVSNVDLFCFTVHVETVVQLVNIGVKPDYTVRVDVDVDEMYKTIGEDKRNYIHSDEYKMIQESWEKKK